MRVRALASAALALVALRVGPAAADQYEVSLHVQPGGGVAWLGTDGTSATARVAVGGGALRATYGLRDWLAIEGELRGVGYGTARYDELMLSVGGGTPAAGGLTRPSQGARLTAAATLRLGVVWIPTVSLGLGVLARRWGDGTIVGGIGDSSVADGREATLTFAPVGVARLGLDRRVNRRLVVGVAAGGALAPLGEAVAEVEAHGFLAYYFYPAP